jgi:hypothetical protein
VNKELELELEIFCSETLAEKNVQCDLFPQNMHNQYKLTQRKIHRKKLEEILTTHCHTAAD